MFDKAMNNKAINDEAGNDKAGDDKAGNDKAMNDEAMNAEAGNNKPATNQAATAQAVTAQAGNNQAGNDQARNNQAGNNQARNDQAGNDQAGNNQAGNNQAGTTKPGTTKLNDQAGNDQARNDQVGNDQARNDQARNGTLQPYAIQEGVQGLLLENLFSVARSGDFPPPMQSLSSLSQQPSPPAPSTLTSANLMPEAVVEQQNWPAWLEAQYAQLASLAGEPGWQELLHAWVELERHFGYSDTMVGKSITSGSRLPEIALWIKNAHSVMFLPPNL
ncbi:hypothetical protein BS47DRAFT_1368672 [Hydnum rufescens UP504]|uniref:Uncharacterized protein n=1 Tax=Hydnum rufescens UP504 TaxID=1448309 RepID=A0A9P6DMZ6_9AGAM|nr:hypothetical protein BS47DRAFT_1368672 [Hydnum rufescens UP504]